MSPPQASTRIAPPRFTEGRKPLQPRLAKEFRHVHFASKSQLLRERITWTVGAIEDAKVYATPTAIDCQPDVARELPRAQKLSGRLPPIPPSFEGFLGCEQVATRHKR